MLIKEETLGHWMDHFYGYGAWNAKIWFVAYEEGGGDLPEDVADRFNYFYNNHREATDPTLCDIRELYKHVAGLYEYRFGPKATQHGSWKNLIAFQFGFRGKKLPDLLKYQVSSFIKDDAALINLYPLPSPHNHAWYYSWLDMPQFPFLKDRKVYEAQAYERRIRGIIEKMKVNKPEIVVMYGMSDINDLKNSFSSKFKMV